MQINLNLNSSTDPQDLRKNVSKLKTFRSTSIRNCFTLTSIFLLFTIFLYVCNVYTNPILIWLEKQDTIIVYLVILTLFMIVSFPVSVGYIVIVIATGYLFGIVTGLSLCIFGANLGLFVAHNVLKVLGHKTLQPLITSETATALFRVISGPSCFRIVLCTRLTPIPFGLQNTIFAVSNVGSIYFVASFIGLLPGQIVGIYVGSSVRSMQNVVDKHEISTTTYALATGQLVLALALLVWLGSKARKELARAIAQAENKTSFSIV